MRSFHITAVSVVLVCGVMVGCGSFASPSARVVGVGIQDFGLKALTLKFDVNVKNPNAVKLPLMNLDYSLASDGKPFLSGDAQLQGFVPANGEKVVPLLAKVGYLELLEVLTKFKPGSVVPYQGELGLSVDIPVLGRKRLPLKAKGSIPIPAIPSVELTEIRWDKLTLETLGPGVEGS